MCVKIYLTKYLHLYSGVPLGVTKGFERHTKIFLKLWAQRDNKLDLNFIYSVRKLALISYYIFLSFFWGRVFN